MTGRTDYRKEFISLFSKTGRSKKRHQVFEDFISCSVISMTNALEFNQASEDKYLRIVGRYEKEDVNNFAHLFAHVVNGLEQKQDDFLGTVYMDLELGDKDHGQYFTPWSVSQMMANLTLGDLDERFTKQPFIKVDEPACGSGCMLLAYAHMLNTKGYPVHRHMWFSATDIDPLAAGMAYIQLSLCGLAGEVVIGDTLLNQRRRVLYTPGHFLGNWPFRLNNKPSIVSEMAINKEQAA